MTLPELPAVSGVPQGSVLGPLLFIMFIDDISTLKLSSSSKLVLYADDIVLYKFLQSNSDFLQLQENLNLINEWSDSKHLNFNGQKSKYMILSNKKKLRAESPVLTIGAAEIERVHEFQYLGATITSTLSWSEHIHNTARKVRKLLYEIAVQTILWACI